MTFGELRSEVFLEVSKNNSYRRMSQTKLPEAIMLSSCSDNSRLAIADDHGGNLYGDHSGGWAVSHSHI